MADLIERARSATRESKQIEFKAKFDPASSGEWCEIIKDIVAVANSGGGIILFGVNDDGSHSGIPSEPIRKIDLADLSNKITKYTGCADPLVEIQEVERRGHLLPAFIIQPAVSLLVFGIQGQYADEAGKQKSAFAKGTIYFRHGAKSEPGTSEDLRSSFQRLINQTRNSWLRQVRKVVRAPAGSEFVVQTPPDRPAVLRSGTVRAVDDPKAIRVTLTRDPSKGGGTYLHEEVSEGIFDEINNVIDANRVLAKGQARFFLGFPVYYRVYAARRLIKQEPDQIYLLYHAAASEFYAPNLFWTLGMNAEAIARDMVALYLSPRSPQIHWLMRTAILLGEEFSRWLYGRWDQKWHNYSQPPSFYFTFGKLIENLGNGDLRLLAARSTASTRISVPGQPETACADLLEKPDLAEALLSSACTAIFEGNSQFRDAARTIDYFAHGSGIIERAKEIAGATVASIGDQRPGDYRD
ncbi:MAG: ATP-binding protein [Terracidiphilus sp.]|jgi:hypothetical protein